LKILFLYSFAQESQKAAISMTTRHALRDAYV